MLKWYGTEISKRRKDLKVIIAGFRGIGAPDQQLQNTTDELQITIDWLRSRASSIEGGTSEIQLNIIARQLLGLPD